MGEKKIIKKQGDIDFPFFFLLFQEHSKNVQNN